MLTAEIVATRKDGPVDHNTLDSCKLIVTFTETEEKDVDHVRARLAALKLVALEAVNRRPAGGNADEDPRDDRDPGDRGYRGADRRPDRRDDRPPPREERDRRDDRRPARDEDRPRKVWGWNDVPKTGRQLWAWCGDNRLKPECAALGKAWNLPERTVDWDDRDAQDAYHELKTKHGRTAEPATNGTASNGRWGGGR